MGKLKQEKAITLIALIVTIIVLLILAAISVTMLTGTNGLLTKANTAKEETKKAEYKERLEMIKIGLQPEKILKKLNTKEYMDRYEEEIRKDNVFEEASIIRKNDETIQVITKEGYIYLVTEESVEYVENPEETPPDIQESDIEFIINPSTWTRENVEVTIKVTLAERYTLQYTIEDPSVEDNWKDYITAVTMTQNGEIYARVKDSSGQISGYATGKVTIIDKTDPTIKESIQTILPSYVPKTPETPQNGSIYTDSDGNKAPIPKGFTRVEGTVDTGLVIKDNSEGSQFVWVPVNYPVATAANTGIEKITGSAEITITGSDTDSGIKTIENITTQNITKTSATSTTATYTVTANGDYTFKVTDTVGNSTSKTITISDIQTKETGNKAMAYRGSSDNSKGILYDFKDGNSEAVFNLGSEPTYLTSSTEGDASSYNTVGLTAESLQNEYNKMIESVEKYRGFYVSRYEMSAKDSTSTSRGSSATIQSKANVMPTNQGGGSGCWYLLYKVSKTYEGSEKSVGSSMIWGSQYDAMMNWLFSNGMDVTSPTPIQGTSYNKTPVTGSVASDKLNNVYDLLGCCKEITLESDAPNGRWFRGADRSLGDVFFPMARTKNKMNYANDGYSAVRFTLYIK